MPISCCVAGGVMIAPKLVAVVRFGGTPQCFSNGGTACLFFKSNSFFYYYLNDNRLCKAASWAAYGS